MNYVTPIITPIVEYLLIPVKRHLGFWVSSTNYVKDMHTKVTELDSNARDMHTKHLSNKANSLVVPHRVPNWLDEVENVIETSKRIPGGGVGCFNIKMRYQVGKQSSDIVKVINRLMREKSDIVWTGERIPLAMVSSPKPSTSTIVHDENQDQNNNKIRSRDLIFNIALKSLEGNNNKTQKMALCGMAGVGKTTMMEQLKKAAKNRKMFDWIVTVDVGQNPNPLTCQQTVAEYIGEALTETNKDTRAERLQKRFEGMSEEGKKNILVILDDVWAEFNLRDIGLMSPLPSGFKLLLTSREETVCTQMGVEAGSIFRMVVLEQHEAKQLFWEIVGLISPGDTEADLHEIGEDIIKGCGGLPIAINTIASTLRDNKSKDEWKHALFCLQNKEFRTLDKIFEISYNNLEDYVKDIFLLSGLFPDDYNIVIEDLVMYGWGLKFYQNVHTIAIARSRVNTCINKLIRSNLLTKSDRKGCVKMHDLVRDFILSNFTKVKQVSIVSYESRPLNEDDSYERILLKCGGMLEFPPNFNYPNLSLLILRDGNELLKFRDDFYSRMEKLEVVCLEVMHRPLLPQYSTNLRALFLRSCSLANDDISFLGDLINLEIVSLANCGIHKLPYNMGKLKKLKLLDLTGCDALCIDDGVLQNLEKLEELYMSVFQNWDRKGSKIRFTDSNYDELKILSSKLSALEVEFFEKYVSFEKLDRFRISIGCLLEKKMDYDSNIYSFTNTLKLMISCRELFESKISELFRKTEILYLEINDMIHLEDVLTHPPQHSFCNLKSLHVCGSTGLECLFTATVAEGLRKLERLVVKSCPLLKEIWSSETSSSEDSVNNIFVLREIDVEDCNSLVNLFPSNPMRLLSHLEEISVVDCCSIEVLFNIDLSKTEQLSSNIRSIQVWKCERFRNIVTPTTDFHMRALENISIKKCRKYGERKFVKNSQEEQKMNSISKVGDNMSVVAFPSYHITNNFHHLRMIRLEYCNEVELLFEIESPNNQMLPYLEDLDLWHMHKLTHVWKCINWQEFFILHKYQAQASFQKLTTITIYKCNSIKYLFSPLMAKLLSNLKKVVISDCDLMEEVVSNRDGADEDEDRIKGSAAHHTPTTLFPRLHLLGLFNMPNLKRIDDGQSKLSPVGVLSWSLCQYSTEIRIRNCPSLSNVIPSYAAGRMQNLRSMNIEYCSSIIEVFDTKEINNANNVIGGFSSANVLAIPRPRNVTMHTLPNLKKLEIAKCERLEYVFTFSVLESIKKLEILTVSDCEAMKMIVRETCSDQTITSSKDVVFPHLKSIKLDRLPNLEGFFLGMSTTFQWPLLDDVMIYDCPQMMAFTSGMSTTAKLKYMHTELGKHYLDYGLKSHMMPALQLTPSSNFDSLSCHTSILKGRPWSFHNLMECNLDSYNFDKIFPSNELQHLQKLETVNAKSCSYAEVLFEVGVEVANNESQTIIKIPKLREVDLDDLPRLKCIWRSNQLRILKFPNLTRLSINECSSLEHVFTCSMVSCVMQLQELHVQFCRNMKVLVKKEDHYDAKVSTIVFPCLKSLKLEFLSSLLGFSIETVDFIFPSMNTLVIKQCSRLTLFTQGRSVTPKLIVVDTSFGSFNVGEDINSFIITTETSGK